MNQRPQKNRVSKYDSVETDLFIKVVPELSKSEYGSEAYKENLQKIKPAIDLVEMIADWMAASIRNPNGDVIDSIEKNQKRFGYSDELKSILKNTAREFITDIQIMETHDRYVGE